MCVRERQLFKNPEVEGQRGRPPFSLRGVSLTGPQNQGAPDATISSVSGHPVTLAWHSTCVPMSWQAEQSTKVRGWQAGPDAKSVEAQWMQASRGGAMRGGGAVAAAGFLARGMAVGVCRAVRVALRARESREQG